MRNIDEENTERALADDEVADDEVAGSTTALERRGRWWLIVSFLACPCHLPLTLAALAAVLGGTGVGVALRERTVLAGVVIALAWAAGTARGLVLVRRAERTGFACPLPGDRR